MFPRLLLPAMLLVLAIASPWLVQDWFNGRTGQGESRAYEALMSFPERVRRKFDGSGSIDSGVKAEKITTVDSTGSSATPYPLALRTRKLLQGLVPSALLSSRSLPGNPDDVFRVPGSVRVDAILERNRARSSGDLDRLGLRFGDPIFVRVFKEEEELELWLKKGGDEHFTLFRIYRIRHWSGELGPKLRNGDRQGPEGFYYVSGSDFRPETRHHLGLDLGYPNDYDRHHGRTGSSIMIHGGASSAGSFALAPEDMEEVYTLASAALENGQRFFRVNVFPFRMTDARMAKEWERQPEWIDFWSNLKEGYDFFENVNSPPDARVESGRYTFLIQ